MESASQQTFHNIVYVSKIPRFIPCACDGQRLFFLGQIYKIWDHVPIFSRDLTGPKGVKNFCFDNLEPAMFIKKTAILLSYHLRDLIG